MNNSVLLLGISLVHLLQFIQFILLIVVGVQVLYFLFYALGSLAKRSRNNIVESSDKQHKIVVIIPGYKEDQIIMDTATQALIQDYPRALYEVIICADSFEPATIAALKKLDLTVIEVKLENSTKANSIHQALEHTAPLSPDMVVILDADNIMAPDFLSKMNAAYNNGSKAIQGHRTAKNQDVSISLLDAINEEICNNIFRKGHQVWGISSALIGSGMAFDYAYFKKMMDGIDNTAWEDKLLELKILKDNNTIEYIEDAYVYDEKVSNFNDFTKQRTRWMQSQFETFRKYFLDGVKELIRKGNVDYFDKVYQQFLIPKVVLIGLLGLLAMLSLVVDFSIYWLLLMVAYYVSLMIAIPKKYYRKETLKALFNIPKAMLSILRSILRMNGKNAHKFERTEKRITLQE